MRTLTAIICSGLGVALLATAVSAQSDRKPPVPKGIDPGGVAAAFVGPGVDYTKPVIAAQLARDGEGELIAWDFIDNDALPYLPMPSLQGRPRAAPPARQIPIRADPTDAQSLARAVAFINATPARIVAISMWTGPPASWEHLRQLAEKHRQLFFVVAVDEQVRSQHLSPDWSALLMLDNVVVIETPRGDNQGVHLPFVSWIEVSRFVDCHGSRLLKQSAVAMRSFFVGPTVRSADTPIRGFVGCQR